MNAASAGRLGRGSEKWEKNLTGMFSDLRNCSLSRWRENLLVGYSRRKKNPRQRYPPKESCVTELTKASDRGGKRKGRVADPDFFGMGFVAGPRGKSNVEQGSVLCCHYAGSCPASCQAACVKLKDQES